MLKSYGADGVEGGEGKNADIDGSSNSERAGAPDAYSRVVGITDSRRRDSLHPRGGEPPMVTDQRAAATRIRNRAPGFTLIELAVVLFIMGLMMLIAMPYFGGFQEAQLKSEARRLASRINYLYQEAGAQKILLRLTFDIDNNSYFATRLDPFASQPAFLPEPDRRACAC